MLAYLLSLTVALASLAVYLSAFFFPEIHRKNDFIWSGVGLFYGLVLWIFAPRITGGLLLGHLASVSLLVWFGWQTLSLRRQLIPEAQQTPLPSLALMKVTFQETISKFSVQENWTKLQAFIGNIVDSVKSKVQKKASESSSAPVENIEKVPEVVTSDLSAVVEVESVQEIVNVSVSSESDVQIQNTSDLSAVVEVESVQEIVDVSISLESEIVQVESAQEVVNVSVSLESDIQPQTTAQDVTSDLSDLVEVAPAQEFVDASLSSEVENKIDDVAADR